MARWWIALIGLDVIIAFVIQLVLILDGGPDPNTGDTVATVGVGTRMIQTFSFFTIQSNLLVLIVAATLIIGVPRDGRVWDILRVDALLGITITGLVFDLVLIHYVHPTGWQLVATIGFHYVAPWASVLGWLLFRPRLRIDRSTIGWTFVWPIAWIVYTFVRGAIVHWYPYPFLDVDTIGFWTAARNVSFVVGLAVALLAVFATVDRRRTARGSVGGSEWSLHADPAPTRDDLRITGCGDDGRTVPRPAVQLVTGAADDGIGVGAAQIAGDDEVASAAERDLPRRAVRRVQQQPSDVAGGEARLRGEGSDDLAQAVLRE